MGERNSRNLWTMLYILIWNKKMYFKSRNIRTGHSAVCELHGHLALTLWHWCHSSVQEVAGVASYRMRSLALGVHMAALCPGPGEPQMPLNHLGSLPRLSPHSPHSPPKFLPITRQCRAMGPAAGGHLHLLGLFSSLGLSAPFPTVIAITVVTCIIWVHSVDK